MKIRNVILGFAVLLFTAILGACGDVSTVGNPTGFNMPTGHYAFYTDVSKTAPVIEGATSMSINSGFMPTKATGWEGGNPLYAVFNLFREYRYPDDEGIIDMTNLYKFLWEAGTQYTQALDSVEGLPVPTVIASPFDFGNTPRTYTRASDHAALASEGDTINVLLSFVWTDDDPAQTDYGVIEGSLNETTGEIMLDLVYLVDFTDAGDFSQRTYVAGNQITHEFTIKSSLYITGENGYRNSIIGAGISESDNADDYFLLKIKDNEGLAGYENGRYYKLPSSADENTLRNYAVTGYNLAEIDDPNGYATAVDALSFFAMDGSDHATSISDFSNGDLTLEY